MGLQQISEMKKKTKLISPAADKLSKISYIPTVHSNNTLAILRIPKLIQIPYFTKILTCTDLYYPLGVSYLNQTPRHYLNLNTVKTSLYN